MELRVKGMKYTLWGLQALAATNVIALIIQKIL
jgi:hypothetical protein